MHLTFTILRNASSLSLHILLSFTSEKACCQVSCSSTACDWTTGRKKSHSNSNKLTDKWGVDCCVKFMATDDVTEHVVYKRRGSACCVCTETKLQQISARKTLISHSQHYLASITESALQIKLRLSCCIHSNPLRPAVAVLMRRRKCPIKSMPPKLSRFANRDIRANNRERRRRQCPQKRKWKEEVERRMEGKGGWRVKVRGRGEREGKGKAARC